MRIADISIDCNIFLAPMAGITDMPFRTLCRENGCGLVYTEMVSAKGLFYKDKSTSLLTATTPEEQPAAIQIFGSEPEIMAEAVGLLKDNPAVIIDINMGCPTPKITSNGDGSSLMRDPALAARIIRAVVGATKRPVTVKIRKGWDDSSINAVEFAKMAEASGAAAIAVHGRTRQQFFKGKVDLGIIGEVKRAVSIPVIGNGDIYTPEDAARMFDETGCDAVMIGRGALGNPWIFKRVKHFLQTGEILPQPIITEKINMVRRHLDMMLALKGERSGLLEMRKHTAWYIKGIKNSAAVRDTIFRLENKEEVLEVLKTLKDNAG